MLLPLYYHIHSQNPFLFLGAPSLCIVDTGSSWIIFSEIRKVKGRGVPTRKGPGGLPQFHLFVKVLLKRKKNTTTKKHNCKKTQSNNRLYLQCFSSWILQQYFLTQGLGSQLGNASNCEDTQTKPCFTMESWSGIA